MTRYILLLSVVVVLTLMVQGAGALDLGNYTVSSIGYSMQSCDQTLVDTNNDDTFKFRFFDPTTPQPYFTLPTSNNTYTQNESYIFINVTVVLP